MLYVLNIKYNEFNTYALNLNYDYVCMEYFVKQINKASDNATTMCVR